MIDPVLFKIFGFEIRYYGILMVFAFLTGYYLLKRFAKNEKYSKDMLDDYLFFVIIAAIVGARLFEVFFYEPSYYFSNPIQILYLWEGGIASHGAMIGLFLMSYWFCKKNKISFFKFGDYVVLALALPIAFIRIGNFINGELVGKITLVPWAVKFNNYEGLRHPVQLYQAFTDVINFGILLQIRKIKNLPEGILVWCFFGIYSLFRFFTEFFKDLPPSYGFEYLGLNLAQWASLVLIIVSSFMILKKLKKI